MHTSVETVVPSTGVPSIIGIKPVASDDVVVVMTASNSPSVTLSSLSITQSVLFLTTFCIPSKSNLTS